MNNVHGYRPQRLVDNTAIVTNWAYIRYDVYRVRTKHDYRGAIVYVSSKHLRSDTTVPLDLVSTNSNQ